MKCAIISIPEKKPIDSGVRPHYPVDGLKNGVLCNHRDLSPWLTLLGEELADDNGVDRAWKLTAPALPHQISGLVDVV